MNKTKKNSTFTTFMRFITAATIVFIISSPKWAEASPNKEISFYLYQEQIQGTTNLDKIKSFLVTKNMIFKHYFINREDKKFLKYRVTVINAITGSKQHVRVVFPSK